MPDFGDHVGEIILAHVADLAQRGKITLGQKVEMLDHRLHGGIEAIMLLELDGKAFGEIACAYTGWIETLQDCQHRFDLGERRTELLGRLGQALGQIAGLVDQVDQMAPDYAADRIGNRKRQLLGEMIDQRDLGRNKGLKVVVRVGTRPGANASPLGLNGQIVGARRRGLTAIVRIGRRALGPVEPLGFAALG